MRGLDDLAGLDIVLCNHPVPAQAEWLDVQAAVRSVVAQARGSAAFLRAKLSTTFAP